MSKGIKIAVNFEAEVIFPLSPLPKVEVGFDVVNYYGIDKRGGIFREVIIPEADQIREDLAQKTPVSQPIHTFQLMAPKDILYVKSIEVRQDETSQDRKWMITECTFKKREREMGTHDYNIAAVMKQGEDLILCNWSLETSGKMFSNAACIHPRVGRNYAARVKTGDLVRILEYFYHRIGDSIIDTVVTLFTIMDDDTTSQYLGMKPYPFINPPLKARNFLSSIGAMESYAERYARNKEKGARITLDWQGGFPQTARFTLVPQENKDNDEDDKGEFEIMRVRVGDEISIAPVFKGAMWLTSGFVSEVRQQGDGTYGGIMTWPFERTLTVNGQVQKLPDDKRRDFFARHAANDSRNIAIGELVDLDEDEKRTKPSPSPIRKSFARDMGPNGGVTAEILRVLMNADVSSATGNSGGDLLRIITVDGAGQFPLTPTQEDAIKMVRDNEGVLLIQGPPGTGKSALIAACCKQILLDDPEAKILVTAPSNKATDGLALKVNEALGTDEDGRLKAIRIMTNRLESGLQANSPIAQMTLAHLAHIDKPYAEMSNQLRSDYNADVAKVTQDLQAHEASGKTDIDAEIQEQLEEIRKKHSELQKKTLEEEGPSVILTTCWGAMSWHIKFIPFTHVIVDECGQATLAETLFAAMKLDLKDGKVLLLTGDSKQLTPVNTAEGPAGELKTTTATAILEANGHAPRRRLNKSFRLHKNFVPFISQSFYDGQLEAFNQAAERDYLLKMFPWPRAGCPFVFVATDSLDNFTSSSSRENRGEAALTKSLVKYIRQSPLGKQSSLMIITPYRGQKLLLMRELPDERVETVNTAQGAEADMAIFGAVRGSANQASTVPIGFLRDTGRLNVGLSRSKAAQWMFGNPWVLKLDPLWRQLVFHMSKMGCLIDGSEAWIHHVTTQGTTGMRYDGEGLLQLPVGVNRITPELLEAQEPRREFNPFLGYAQLRDQPQEDQAMEVEPQVEGYDQDFPPMGAAAEARSGNITASLHTIHIAQDNFFISNADSERMRSFSNFASTHPKYIVANGNKFYTVEHGYQWGKAMFHQKPEIANKIINVMNPAEAKALGSTIKAKKIHTAWYLCKPQIMFPLLLVKFLGSRHYRERLMKTKGALLEASTDDYWGIGVAYKDCPPTSQWTGRNMLGNMLEHIRSLAWSDFQVDTMKLVLAGGQIVDSVKQENWFSVPLPEANLPQMLLVSQIWIETTGIRTLALALPKEVHWQTGRDLKVNLEAFLGACDQYRVVILGPINNTPQAEKLNTDLEKWATPLDRAIYCQWKIDAQNPECLDTISTRDIADWIEANVKTAMEVWGVGAMESASAV